MAKPSDLRRAFAWTCRRAAGLCAAVVLLVACGRADPSESPGAGQVATLSPTPVTIEVTRVVVTERVVTVTPQPPVSCAQPDPAGVQEVVVAALLPLTQIGALSSSLSVQVALSVAATEINASGGIDGTALRLTILDTGGRPDMAQAAARRAISDLCAVALLVTQPVENIEAIAAVAAGTSTPVIVLDAADDSLTSSASPFLFRLAPTNAMLAAMYGDWLANLGDYNEDGYLESILVIEGTAAGREYGALIADAIEKMGVTAEIFETDLPRDDFTSLIARIVVRERPPDSLLIRFNGENAAALQRQLAANGIGPQRQTVIVATRSALNDTDFWPLVGEAGAFTVVGRAGPWSSTANERGHAFASQYQAWMQRWPDLAAFLAYDSLWLVRDAVLRAGSFESAELISALERTNLAGAAGRYTFPISSRTAPGGAVSAGQPAWAWHQWLEPPLAFLQYTATAQPAAEMAVIWPPALAASGPIVRPAPED